MADKKALGKAAESAVTSNLSTLIDALSPDLNVFRKVVTKCEEKKLLTSRQSLLDLSTGRSLQDRANGFVSQMQKLVKIVPEDLDKLLCILYDSEDRSLQAAADLIGKDYNYELPQYQQAVAAAAAGRVSTGPRLQAASKQRTGTANGHQLEVLNVTHLQDVLNSLRKSHFSNHNWRRLGLALGLYEPTLNGIDANYPRDVARCLEECLSKWLKKADGVKDRGGPTIAALAGALKGIGEIATAENIIGQQPTIKSQSLYKGTTNNVHTLHTVETSTSNTGKDSICNGYRIIGVIAAVVIGVIVAVVLANTGSTGGSKAVPDTTGQITSSSDHIEATSTVTRPTANADVNVAASGVPANDRQRAKSTCTGITAITENKGKLIDVLSISEPVFRSIVTDSEAQELITSLEAADLVDTMKGESLQARAGRLIQLVQSAVKYSPDQLNVFLNILQEKGNPPVKAVANDVAEACN